VKRAKLSHAAMGVAQIGILMIGISGASLL
jgi:hypothetical protein